MVGMIVRINAKKMGSDGESPSVNLPLDEFVELVPSDGLSSISSYRVHNLDELVVCVAVFQLLVDVSQIIEVQLSFALHVQQ